MQYIWILFMLSIQTIWLTYTAFKYSSECNKDKIGGGSMKPATIVVDLFMTVVSGKKLLPFILNNSALDVEGVLEPLVEKEIELHNCSAITGSKRFFIRFLPHLVSITDILSGDLHCITWRISFETILSCRSFCRSESFFFQSFFRFYWHSRKLSFTQFHQSITFWTNLRQEKRTIASLRFLFEASMTNFPNLEHTVVGRCFILYLRNFTLL